MAFEKVDTQVDFPAQERDVLNLWEKNGIFEKLRQKNRGRPKWSFLDGPITANNPMGVHHAWGRTYKDAYQRFFAMTGHELRYQNGFDCQGLWVEVEVEKELKLGSKRDIENLVPGDYFASVDKFVRLCKERVDKYAKVQTEQSIRLGYWMDWDRAEDWQKPPDERRSYFTMSEENNYSIWSFLKKCHERGLIYRGYDAMPWCPRCSVGLAQMEMHEGYQLVTHRAVFVRFPLRGRPNENLLVWTTTPWTLSSNVGAAVNPNLTYLKVLHKDQIYYLAKGAFTAKRLEEEFKQKEYKEFPRLESLEQIFKKKGGSEVVGEVSGRDMVGWQYDGPFDELPVQQHPGGFPAEISDAVVRQRQFSSGSESVRVDERHYWDPSKSARDAHRVIAWDAVGETEGTGIVHIAPGCGKEDFQLGREQQLPPVAPLDDEGHFLPGFGFLEGRSAVDNETTDAILANLKQKGILLEVERYPHSYPHCWRCKTELLFRLVDEWFINMKWRDEIMRVTEQVTFLPESINGKARELDWLRNMGDWMISKKRFWGLALPIWVCETCGHFDVIGSRTELRERAVEGWDRFEGHTPHRPWIDLVKVQCTACGGKSSRISDVGNPWLDAGIVPYSTMGYNRDRAYWEQWFPADFITESFPGQFRNWFYAILAMSTMMERQSPMKVLLGHGLVLDIRGETMSKSKGNAIAFDEAADKMGADICRWLYCRSNPAGNINFGYGPADELRSKFLLKLWNTYAFFVNYARADKGGFSVNAAPVPIQERSDFDRWILSDLQLLVRKGHEEFTRYNVQAFCQEAENFVEERLSNWYVRRNRGHFQDSRPSKEKLAAFQTLHTVLVTLAELFAPIMPFITEVMYRNLTPGANDKTSVHLCDFPDVDEALIDEELSHEMEALLRLRTLGSAVRNQVKLKVRQPLAEMKVQPANELERRAVERFAGQLTEELNIKKVSLHDASRGTLMKLEAKLNPKGLAARGLGPRLVEIQKAFAAADQAAVIAQIQSGQPFVLECPNGAVSLEPSDVPIQARAPEGWAGLADGATQIMEDARVTPELAREGMAREVVRHVQDSRKNAKLEMEDRITLYLATDDPDLREAINEHRAYICEETLTTEWATQPLEGDAYRTQVKVDGKPLTIMLRKAAS
jgi:isoleucyl-tRNA synthetase